MEDICIMMIGGGVQEARAVQVAKNHGFKVLVTDRNPSAPAFSNANYKAVIDGRDIEGLVAFALLNKKRMNISGVFTFTELVTSVASVAMATELPGVSLQSAVACQNKALCKAIWLEARIPTPAGTSAHSFDEALNIIRRIGSKVFIKPTVGFGDRRQGITGDTY